LFSCWEIDLKYALILALVLALPAFAADVTVSWQHPTRNVDGTAIPATGPGSIAATRVQIGTCASAGVFGTVLNEIVVTGQGTSATFTGVAPASTICGRGYSRNTYAEESGVSNVITRILPAPVPQPPVLSSTVNVAITIDSSYRIKLVGMIPLGTPCSATRKKAGGTYFNGIDASKVALFDGQVGTTFWTICGAA